MFILSFYFDTVAAVFFCIRFLSLFVSRNLRKTLCKFLNVYASLKCMFMHVIMINRKLCGKFEFFSIFAETFYLFTFCFLAFSLILDNLQKTKTETKKPYFCRFCHKTSLFVANKVLIFSGL